MTSTLPHRLPRQRTAEVAPSRTTPYLELDVLAAVRHFVDLAAALPGTAVHYAVKANPHPQLLRELAAVGCRFDVASPVEVRAALAAGATPDDLVYSNPVKRRDHVVEAAALGVRLFVVDSLDEVDKVAEAAPGSRVLCRLLTSGEGSDWPLSRKYGCSTYEAVEVLTLADQLGLEAAGVSFHVGSQQRDPEAWAGPIAASARVFELLRTRGIFPTVLDLGGGFPASHEEGCRPVSSYGEAIDRHLRHSFGEDRPETLVEPGRGIVGDAGTLVASVIGVIDRGGVRWVYLDAGVFTGLVETLEEAIRYRITTSAEEAAEGAATRPCVLAGPTCDSADVLYQDRMVDLPVSLCEGDEVRLLSSGAYTSCYSTVGFNGFAPLPTFLLDR
ncbi:type III PLP-dependent enzyme [Marmoricola sp. URHB0036]|uniref:type III PLP-dependent enzyme n=1 Tax=Marmoricola sp. URHB0036 TaxID=1298863 RepID=UPI00041566DF|nr:type III PLP-dependent enzyme [Marmoricola sp. URHB0036]